jgi:hypothetical protein
LIALGYEVDEIQKPYQQHVPTIMKHILPAGKSKALADHTKTVFSKSTFEDVKTGIGIVATKWIIERPMIFKGDIAQAHGRKGTFVRGLGVSIADAVQASCSAYPFFNRKRVITSAGDRCKCCLPQERTRNAAETRDGRRHRFAIA